MKLLASKRLQVASLMLNIFLLTGIAGAAWRWQSMDQTSHARGLRYAANELAPEQRRNYLLGLREARRMTAGQLQIARESRQDVLRLMAAPQFNRDAVGGALARTRAADLEARARVEEAVADFAATLSPEDRRKFVEALERRSSLGSANSTPPR